MNRRLGRYVVLDELAAGGMGRVHIGKLHAEGGFARIVAIKVLHDRYARQPELREMFLDEARLVASIRHPNVVSTLDVLEDQGELFLIMDYVNGLPVSQIVRDLRRVDKHVPIPVVAAILIDALEGLHAAHEVRGDNGVPLAIVHRDVSPQNIMVGDDGLARVVDFGVAHARVRLHQTMPGKIKGKASYMAPEQASNRSLDRRADIYGAGIVMWEALAGARLFQGATFGEVALQHLQEKPAPPSSQRADVSPELDAIVARALEKLPEDRFQTAHEMAEAIERAVRRASRSEVAAWLESTEPVFLAERRALVNGLPREPLASRPAVREAAEATVPEAPQAKLAGAPTLTAVEQDSVLVDGRAGSTPARARRIAAVVVGVALVGTMLVAARGSRGVRPVDTAGQAPSQVSIERPATEPPALAPSSEPFLSLQAPSAPRPPATAAPSESPVRVVARPPPTRRPVSPAPAPASSAFPSAQIQCCTPDGTLQLRFHDCVNNCTN